MVITPDALSPGRRIERLKVGAGRAHDISHLAAQVAKTGGSEIEALSKNIAEDQRTLDGLLSWYRAAVTELVEKGQLLQNEVPPELAPSAN